MSRQNNRTFFLAAQIGFMAFMGCELSEVRDGDYCEQNVEGYSALDSFHDVDLTISQSIIETHSCALDYPYCLDSVENNQNIASNKKYCSKCAVDMVYVSPDDSSNKEPCITCAELKTCETEACKKAKENKKVCPNHCEGNTLYDYDHKKIRECDYECVQSQGTGGFCTCPTGQIMNADDKCVCDTVNHWKGVGGNCICEDGYHADGDQCVEDSDNCGIGKIPNAERKCVCDADNGWTKASDESDECICADTHLLISGSCVKKQECGKGEILNENNNTCICDNANYWVGIAGSCACLNGYEETDGICQAPINCTTGEFYDEETKKCKCDTLNGWTGDSGKCVCQTGYQLVDGDCTQIICKTGAVLNKTTNTCACDTEKNWTGADPAKCSCKSGYLPISGKCEEQKTCKTGAVLNKTTNTCACDTEKNWTGSDPEKCSCPFGYKKDGNTCRLYKVGETFSFGNYYINNDKTKEPINWKILEIANEKYLLLSEYGLDVMEFNPLPPGISESANDTTSWEDSALHEWLNKTFLDKAFIESDRSRLWSKNNTTVDLMSECTGGLCAFHTKTVFLKTAQDRQASPTPYAQPKLGSGCSKGAPCFWWLKDANDYGGSQLVKFVYPDGTLPSHGCHKNNINMVRPVIWVRFK